MFMLFIDLILPSRSFDFEPFASGSSLYTRGCIYFGSLEQLFIQKKQKLSNAMTTLLYIVLLIAVGPLSIFYQNTLSGSS